MSEPQASEPRATITDSQIGVIGDHAHIEGGIHFYAATPGKIAPPCQLPPRVPHFTGREAELAQLLNDLQPGRVVTLCGPGGIGKSALASEVLWRNRDEISTRFPDGILFHSFYNQPQVMFALEAIARTYGEELRPTPRDAVIRALSGKCALLLLDGAENADDLHTVLDVVENCGVLVTSRSRADAGPVWQDIPPLPECEALRMLRQWAGEYARDESTARQICALIGCLPLAVRLVGRYLSQQHEPATEYITWLETTPLEALDQRQRRQESVPVLLEKSLAQAGVEAREILGVVGLLALAKFERKPVAAALDCPIETLRKPLSELVNYGLLQRSGEYYEVTHALIYTYTRERMLPAAETLRRLVDYYTALTGEQQALGLPGYQRLTGERVHLLQVLCACADNEEWKMADRLAWALSGENSFLDLQGLWVDFVMVRKIGVQAAQMLHNRRSEGGHLGNLGITYRDLGYYQEAIVCYEQALIIARETGNRRGEGIILGNLGIVHRDLKRIPEAISYCEQALIIAREIDDLRGESNRLGILGNIHIAQGNISKAIEFCEQALILARKIRDRRGEGDHLSTLGRAFNVLQHSQEAIRYYEQALAIAQEIGDRRGEGNRLASLGGVYCDLGQVEKAYQYLLQALIIFEEIRSPNAQYIRDTLLSLDATIPNLVGETP